MNEVRRVGLVVHDGRAASIATAERSTRILAGHGVEVVRTVHGPRDRSTGEPAEGPVVAEHELDLVLSFGGDGTFLRAAHLSRDAGVPVLGINLGRLGFLADVEVEELEQSLARVAAGDFTTEPRATLQVEVVGPDGERLHADWALNEISVEKTARQRLLLMELTVGGAFFASVPADALVLATSTGSTAYSLSAGGPIVSPALDALLVTPVAPHSLFDRTLVAAPNECVDVRLLEGQDPAVVSCDGRPPVTVPPGSTVTVTGGARPVVLARMASADFYTLVRRKFGLR